MAEQENKELSMAEILASIRKILEEAERTKLCAVRKRKKRCLNCSLR